MIQFVTGIPGSGKSYYGLFSIAINFNTNLSNNKKFSSYQLSKTKYKYALTNINEVKFENFDNVMHLDFDNFKSILIKLYNHYKLGKSDSELEDLVKHEKFFYTLIVLDECHNFLSKDDEVLVWWLSYHRHFFQDIILITQDLPLVNKKYKSFSEFYYKAIPSSRKLFNIDMIYHQYTGSQMYKTQLAIKKKLPILKEVFDLYGSGENNKQKSLVKHFLIISLVIFVIVLISGTIFLKNFFGGGVEPVSPVQQQQKQISNNTKNVKKKSDNEFYTMICNFNYCFINGNYFEKKFINKILKDDYKANIIANSKYKTIFSANDKYNFFKQKVTQQKDLSNETNNILDTFNFGIK